MFAATCHSNRCLAGLAAILLAVGFAGGCALYDADRLNLDRFRDEQAVDIEQRLTRQEPIVKNPF
ncbi:MAG: hypothetical protein L0Z07_08115 [Planctomycetes bacterium]|nr:hypothetical protein [Planctomycetota bacterium]